MEISDAFKSTEIPDAVEEQDGKSRGITTSKKPKSHSFDRPTGRMMNLSSLPGGEIWGKWTLN